MGSSVYCLSPASASSEAAKLLARKENLADIIGGASNGDNNEESDPIILDMFQTNTLNTSRTLGVSMLKHIEGVSPLKFRTVQGAPFRVLKLPEIPSLLVETAYISNKTEEKLLRSREFQAQMAEALAATIVDRLPVAPSAQPPLQVARKESKIGPKEVKRYDFKKDKTIAKAPGEGVSPATQTIIIYMVKKGDSLGKIAVRNNTTIHKLLTLNRMKLQEPLYVNRKIKIAVPEPAEKPEPLESPKTARLSERNQKEKGAIPPQKAKTALTVYRVKEGDNLDSIARKHGTTLSILLKINGMKLKDPLYVGRLVRLTDDETKEKSPDAPETARLKSKAGESGRPLERTYIYYRVKKGDTLDVIARRNGMTISQLRQLNRMKQNEPLLADKRLKVLQNPSL
jgi:N-acetylmuramoyl-L-alanine amidase